MIFRAKESLKRYGEIKAQSYLWLRSDGCDRLQLATLKYSRLRHILRLSKDLDGCLVHMRRLPMVWMIGHAVYYVARRMDNWPCLSHDLLSLRIVGRARRLNNLQSTFSKGFFHQITSYVILGLSGSYPLMLIELAYMPLTYLQHHILVKSK